MERLTTEELDELEDQYITPDIPPCRVCGGLLTLQAFGRGPAVYGCGPWEDDPDSEDDNQLRLKEGRTIGDDHYSKSRVEVNLGDSRVLRLVQEVREHRGI